jgi:hypothetical protein
MLSTEEKRLRTKERHRRWYLEKKANDASFMAKMAKTSRLYYRKNDAYREVKKNSSRKQRQRLITSYLDIQLDESITI